MDAFEFIDTYFIAPMRDRTGFNPIQTITYAILAITAIFLIQKLFKKKNITIQNSLIKAVCLFVLFGSTVRVLVDADIYPYEINGFYPFITPGIYLIVGAITLLSILLLQNNKDLITFGSLLFLSQLVPLVPLFSNIEMAAAIIVVASLATIVGFIFLNATKNIHLISLPTLAVFAHCFDGAATFIAIDFLSGKYFEQHFFVRSLFSLFNTMFIFLVLKLALSVIFAMMLLDSKDNDERNYYVLILIITGLAPAFRDWLRILCGV